jgi:hypothetical protein
MKDKKIIPDNKPDDRTIEEKGWGYPEPIGGGFYIYRDDQYTVIADRRSLGLLFKQRE